MQASSIRQIKSLVKLSRFTVGSMVGEVQVVLPQNVSCMTKMI